MCRTYVRLRARHPDERRALINHRSVPRIHILFHALSSQQYEHIEQTPHRSYRNVQMEENYA
jgi:hypothetical protein